MKNEMKIILGAIVVILLLLVGAYALSGSSPQPTATPTVTPATATPTPVPSVVPTASPSVAPTVAPTATPVPSVTPTPVPESGVKLTEFGYWITYPPLGPQNWSAPRPLPVSMNVVYFDHASDAVHLEQRVNLLAGNGEPMGEYAYVSLVRSSDAGTTNVTISIDGDLYFDPDQIEHPDCDVTFVDDNHMKVTFPQGKSELHFNLWWLYGDAYEYGGGDFILKIDDTDSGFAKGTPDTYTLTVTVDEPEILPEVYFYEDGGVMFGYSGEGIEHFDGIRDVQEDDDYVTAYVYLERGMSYSGTTTVNFDVMNPYNMTSAAITIEPYTFTGTNNEALIPIRIDREYVYGDEPCSANIYIMESHDYTIGDYDHFVLRMNWLT